MKLFTVGPAQMYQHTIEVRSKVVPYFRTSEFSKMNLESAEMIKNCMEAEQDSEVVFLTASGSGAMEATVMNCFNENDKLLVISGGTFGERFEHICEIHGIPYQALKLGPDEQLSAQHFDKYNRKGFTGLLVNLHETYTGQLYDIDIIEDFCQRNNLFLVVDAISTFLCDPYSMKKHHIDTTIVSSQKGLCLAPGLSVIVLSKRMAEKVMGNKVSTMYFDFKDYFINMQRGQTPFTPCVGVLFELHDMLKFIEENGGISERVKEVKERCDYFRKQVMELPVSLPPFPLSNAITPIRFDKNVATEIFEYLKNEKDIMVNPVGGELGKHSLRIAHIGDLKLADYDMLIKELSSFLV